MKTLVRQWKYLLVCALSVGVLATALAPAEVRADDPKSDPCGSGSFLGFPAWYRGLTEPSGEDCNIKSPGDVDGIGNFIWIIALNVIEMLLRAAGYASVAFIIYGGYKYMISAGSPDGMVAARKTIMNAVIGLVISVAAIAIVNTVSRGLLGS